MRCWRRYSGSRLLETRTGRRVERWHCTLYCLEFCTIFYDAKRQHLSTIKTDGDLSFTIIQQQTYRRKQLMDQPDDNSLTALPTKKGPIYLHQTQWVSNNFKLNMHTFPLIGINSSSLFASWVSPQISHPSLGKLCWLNAGAEELPRIVQLNSVRNITLSRRDANKSPRVEALCAIPIRLPILFCDVTFCFKHNKNKNYAP